MSLIDRLFTGEEARDATLGTALRLRLQTKMSFYGIARDPMRL